MFSCKTLVELLQVDRVQHIDGCNPTNHTEPNQQIGSGNLLLSLLPWQKENTRDVISIALQ